MDDKKVLQNIVLGVLIFFGLLYSHIAFLVGPVRAEIDKLNAEMATAQVRLDSDSGELRKLLAEEQNEARNAPVAELMDRMLATTPRAPLVECPSILTKWAQRHEMPGAKATLKSYLPLPGVNNSTIQSWAVHSSSVKPIAVGEGIAELENQLPMARIGEFAIERNRANNSIDADITIQFAIVR